MREIRTWGSVRGVLSDRHPYRDLRRDATRAPTQRPEWPGRRKPPRSAAILAIKRQIPGARGQRPRTLKHILPH